MSDGDNRIVNRLAGFFELHRGGSADNVRPMEGLRGYAVFLVFLVHYFAFAVPLVPGKLDLPPLSAWFVTFGGSGVDLFFVLSGYLIYGSLISRPQSFPRFMWRRVQRIYPAFTAVFVLYLLLSFLFPAENKIPGEPWAAVLYLVQNYLLLPGMFDITPMIAVAWSLSYEAFYYLALPLVILLFGLRNKSVAWRVLFFSAASAVAVVYCARTEGPIRLVMFAAGILLYEAVQRRVKSRGSLVGVLAIGCIAVASYFADERPSTTMLRQVAFFVSYFVLCLVCFRDATGWLASAFAWTPMRWLGNMSYS